jgi:hypothetical protein
MYFRWCALRHDMRVIQLGRSVEATTMHDGHPAVPRIGACGKRRHAAVLFIQKPETVSNGKGFARGSMTTEELGRRRRRRQRLIGCSLFRN